MIRLHLEWDCGQDRYIFRNESDAKMWMVFNFPFEDFDNEFAGVQDVFDEGFANFEELTIYEPY